MIVDPAVVPGLLLLAAELIALAAVGYVVVRVGLRQADDRAALAQGLVVGPALWGLIVNFVLYVVPGLAGAAVGWSVTLVLGAVLVWRARRLIWPRLRVVAVFALAVLALLWLTLASRQLLESPDPTLHLGLAAWLRAGGFPPEAPWNPGNPVRYHHAVDLLVGLLTPPTGPDLAFVQELLGAYAWTAFALVVATGLLRRGSWQVALVVSPLLLTAGAWTWTSLGGGILQAPVPMDLPTAGPGESLAAVYWPSLGPSWPSEPAALHDVWTPAFTLGYALAFVVLERAARSDVLSWPGVLTLGAIVGFLGILVTSLVPVVLVLWAVLAAVHGLRERRAGAAFRSGGRSVRFRHSRERRPLHKWLAADSQAPDHPHPNPLPSRERGPDPLPGFSWRHFAKVSESGNPGPRAARPIERVHSWRVAMPRPRGNVTHGLRLGTGLGLAVVVILLSGGAFTRILDGPPLSGFELALDLNPRHWAALGAFDAHPGGIGALHLGPIVVAGLAVLLARRDRLVVALAAGAALLLAAWLLLSYPPAPWVLSRLAGHARNLALLALLLALVIRLSSLESARWRTAAGLLLIALVVWPTVVAPVRSLAAAVGSGVQLNNAGWVRQEARHQSSEEAMRRFRLPAMSDQLASHIRDHTPLRARVLTPEWPYWAVSLATGRPSGAGFADLSHLIYFTGPEHLDAVSYLEPAAIRRLGIEWVHATDAWAAALPPRARRWLADPGLFELTARDGAEALYRVRPAFLALGVEPHPESFEALRSAPSATVVHLAPELGWLDGLRVASALSHTRLTGAIDTQPLHLQAPMPWTVEPLGERTPDLVTLPVSLEPSMFPTVAWRLVWVDAADGIAVYAPASSRSRATNESGTTRTASKEIG